MSETNCRFCGAGWARTYFASPDAPNDTVEWKCGTNRWPGCVARQSEFCKASVKLATANAQIAEMQATRDAASVRYAHLQGRNAELTEALKGLVPDDAFNCDDDWWCPECQNAVTATFEERCESCGTYLTDCQPSYEWAKKAKAALEGGA